MFNESEKNQLLENILPHLNKLINMTPQYGEICLKVKIYDYKAGTINLGIEYSQKILKTQKDAN